jgi:hypothetical protein
MLKSKEKACMALEPSYVKQLSLNHVCKIVLTLIKDRVNVCKNHPLSNKTARKPMRIPFTTFQKTKRKS